LRDLANSISVVNTQFLKDTGATSASDLLVYTANTEVGGISGNFSGLGGSSSYNENGKLLRPNANTRVRGLDSADNTRNYFLTESPWDSYNVDRVEMQRGPNSILFGVGSPAGIINVTSKTAFFEDQRSVEIKIDEEGSLRGVVDVNQVILDDELAVRLIALDEHTKYQQKPAYEKDKRIYGAIRYEPKLFGNGSTTSISANFESGDIEANRPRSMPPIDRITAWFNTEDQDGVQALNKLTLDPNTTYTEYSEWNGTGTTYPWFYNAFMGRIMGSDVSEFYSNGSYSPDYSVQAMPYTSADLDGDGVRETTISMDFTRPWAITGYGNYATATKEDGNFYSDYSLSDESIFDFYNNLLDGDNKKEWQEWNTFNASLAQTFLNNRVGFELSYFYQEYEEGQYSLLGGETGNEYSISIDVNSNYVDGTENPYVGYAYVANSGDYGSNQNFIDRNSVRLTAYADIHSTDFLEESWLTRILGHHLVSGLLSRDVRENDYRSFMRWALDTDYTDLTGQVSSLTVGTRSYDWVYYISDEDLSQYDSASGLNLSNVSTVIDPGDSVTMSYFDTTWTATNVDPDSGWDSDGDGYIDSTQALNPDNYGGWTTETFDLLNAEDGDIDDLYTSATKSRNRILSEGITLQSYMFDDNLVFTYGWRKDKVKTISAVGTKNDGLADTSFALDEHDDDTNVNTAEGQSRTWGVVLHAPEFITKHLPWDMKLSAFYGKGNNFKADAPRGDIFGNQIDNPKGNTEDYGFVVSVLDNRLSLKTTWYETQVTNATLPYASAGIGGTLYKVWSIPYRGVAHALNALDYLVDPTYRQFSGWYPGASVGYDSDTETYDLETIFNTAKDFIVNLPVDQNFCDEYGLLLDISAIDAAKNVTYDSSWTAEETMEAFEALYAVFPSWEGATVTGVAPETLYDGNLKSFGDTPSCTGDTTSKGIEFELNAQITDNWNLTVNASKTEATITSISPTIIEWVETFTEFLEGPAGDLMIWGGTPYRDEWANTVLGPYNALMAKIGSGASEVSPWRFNLVTNYNFSEGFLKGVNVGMAYRWEDKRVLGYQTVYSEDASDYVLDISKPWYGPTEDHIDLWVGYGCALTDKVDWRIQLNVKNVGENNHLVPVYIQPDGSVGYSRIAYGTSWSITNSFEF
jgi:outer membrane receptor protein involved in Fe transport